MEYKIYEIPDILTFEIINDVNVIKTIKSYYPSLKESNAIPEWFLDFENCDTFNFFKNIVDSDVLVPFRNCIYFTHLDKKSGLVFAYSPKREKSVEHGIIRTENYIKIYSNEINGKIFLRTIRELILRKYIEKGYFPLHGSSSAFDGNVTLQFGPIGCGKSTALFKQTAINKFSLMSNDITLVGKENNDWKAISSSYDLTFDSSLFGRLYEKKARFNPLEFCQNYGIKWCGKGTINKISFLTLDKNKKYNEINLSQNEFRDKMFNYGKDSHFYFDDYLYINNLLPTFDYYSLSEAFIATHITGNIFLKKR